jgi:hypothetical protein
MELPFFKRKPRCNINHGVQTLCKWLPSQTDAILGIYAQGGEQLQIEHTRYANISWVLLA